MIFHLAGDMDVGQATYLRTLVTQARMQGERSAVFDCADVTFCDSEGFSVFLYAVSIGLSVRVRAIPPNMRRALQVCGLDALGELFVVE